MYKPTPKEELEKEAEKLGLVAIFPENDEIQVDLDKGMEFHSDCLDILTENEINVLGTIWTTSKDGGQHIHIKIDWPLSTIEQIAFAAAFGSDPVRETLAALYFHNFQHFQMCLFEKPEEAIKVLQWREKVKKDNTP